MAEPPPPVHYNTAAGRHPARLAALSDGVFAIAVTLLVLELHPPPLAATATEAAFLAALAGIAPKLIVWLMSFMTLGIFWVGQATQIEALAASDRDLTWLHLAFLAAVSLLPFTTAVLGEDYRFAAALLVYWVNIAVLGGLLWLIWGHAERAGLLLPDWTAAKRAAMRRRIGVAQSLYLAAMLLGLWRPVAGLVLMLLVQANYAVAPRIGRWLQ